MLSGIRKTIGSGLSKFLMANMLYSLSTALVSLLSPSILPQAPYEDFIYIFQMVLFLTGIFTAGLIPGLLRYHKYDGQKYQSFYFLTAGIIVVALLILGLFPGNFLSSWLKIGADSVADSMLVYSSVIFSLFFIFNRGFQTAKEDYASIFKDVIVIFVARILLLGAVGILGISDPYVILAMVCIIPFLYEAWIFISSFFRIRFCTLEGYPDFLEFIFKISVAGIIFTATSRLFIIASRFNDDSLAAALSFAAGLTGIISIFNTTFSSVFIGKLDYRNHEGILSYMGKVRKYLLPFLGLTLLVGTAVFFFVTLIYPGNTLQAAMISALTVVHCALMSYTGLITLMTKTYNLLNAQIMLNGASFVIVWLFVKFVAGGLSEYISYIIINSVMLLMEFVLAFIVLRHVRRQGETILSENHGNA